VCGWSDGGDHVDAVLLEVVIEPIAVIGPIANEMLRLGLQHVEVDTELHQRDFMMIRRMRPARERPPVAIHNRPDFHALATSRKPHGLAAALGGRQGGVDEALPFINGPFVAQHIGQLGEDLTQDLTLTPLLKPAMDRL